MNITTDQVVTFLGGGLVVFLLDQIIKYFRRERRVLGYTADTRVLVEKSDPDLKITYKDLEVERVHSHKITFRNIGNSCLRDVPVYILPSSGRFFFVQISAKPGIHCPILPTDSGVAFTFDLLNPGEEIDIQLIILDQVGPSLRIDARSEHLRVRELSGGGSFRQFIDAMLEGSSGLERLALQLLKLTLNARR